MAAFMNIRRRKQYCDRSQCSKDYKNLYRFSEESVVWLANHFLDGSSETRGGALTAKKKMEIYLRFLSDPGFQLSVAKEEGVHRTTVCKTISTVLNEIIKKSHIWVKFPINNISEVQNQWSSRFRFPCAIGAIDGTHIKISKPPYHSDEYINRKGFYSINVQATCNAREEFTSIDAQWPGSVHDNRILKRSSIYKIMNRKQTNAIILGDAGYGISRWLLTPYRYPKDAEEVAYNKLLTKERVIIERCFGQLKQRFPILQYKVRVQLHKVPAIIVSCVILHNIAKYLQDELPIGDYEETENEDFYQNYDDDENTSQQHLRRQGQQRREQIKNIINSL